MTYQSHVVTEQPSSAFFVSLPKEADAVSLVLAQECVDARRNLVIRVQLQGTRACLISLKREIRPRLEVLQNLDESL